MDLPVSSFLSESERLNSQSLGAKAKLHFNFNDIYVLPDLSFVWFLKGESDKSSFAVMEMVDRQNQPKIVSNWNNSNKAGDEWKHDRISALPDCVLLEILSCLPSIKDAIKTGTLSKRWNHLWTLVPNLIFNYDCTHNHLSGYKLFPLVETLVFNITSKSLKNLVLHGYMDLDDKFYDPANFIEINASNILSLTLQDYFYLSKLLLLNVSSLVEAKVDYALVNHHEEMEEQMLKGSIINLRHVKDLKIGSVCSEALSRLQAKGFIIPSNVKCHGVTYDRLE